MTHVGLKMLSVLLVMAGVFGMWATPAAAAPADPLLLAKPKEGIQTQLCGTNRERVIAATARASSHYSVPQRLLMGLIWVESGCNARVVSNAGAIGLMQVMPREAGRGFGDRPGRDALFDIDANVIWGTYVLYDMDVRYCGLWHRYNSRYLSKSQLEYWGCALGAFYEGTGVYFTGVLGRDGQRYAEMVIGAAGRVDLK